MTDIIIRGSSDTYFIPTVSFNGTTGDCLIEGESYLEESFEFYDKLSKWFDDFFAEGHPAVKLEVKLTYFNTSSSRAILDLLKRLKKHENEGKKITVLWYYNEPDDDEICLEVEDFMAESKLQIQLTKY